MPQMSPMMWIVFPFVMAGFLVFMGVILGLESVVYMKEDSMKGRYEKMKW